jgi:hypothetical protein
VQNAKPLVARAGRTYRVSVPFVVDVHGSDDPLPQFALAGEASDVDRTWQRSAAPAGDDFDRTTKRPVSAARDEDCERTTKRRVASTTADVVVEITSAMIEQAGSVADADVTIPRPARVPAEFAALDEGIDRFLAEQPQIAVASRRLISTIPPGFAVDIERDPFGAPVDGSLEMLEARLQPRSRLQPVMIAAIFAVSLVTSGLGFGYFGRLRDPLAPTSFGAVTMRATPPDPVPAPAVTTPAVSTKAAEVAPVASPEPSSASATVSVASPSSTTTTAITSKSTTAGIVGTVLTPASASGHRVFIDGGFVGGAGKPMVWRCGMHTIRIGSAGQPQKVMIPCGGVVSVAAK